MENETMGEQGGGGGRMKDEGQGDGIGEEQGWRAEEWTVAACGERGVSGAN